MENAEVGEKEISVSSYISKASGIWILLWNYFVQINIPGTVDHLNTDLGEAASSISVQGGKIFPDLPFTQLWGLGCFSAHLHASVFSFLKWEVATWRPSRGCWEDRWVNASSARGRLPGME